MCEIEFKVSYVSYLPKEGNSPKVTISGDYSASFHVDFIDSNTGNIIFTGICKTNNTIIGGRQWFTKWLINIYDESGTLVFTDLFNPTGKVVFIKCDSFALGDNIAWIPYIKEFRKINNCTVISSTFFNDLFEGVYPELLFVKPDTRIANVYAQYYIGADDSNNIKYSPVNSKLVPLQMVASSILGLEFKEIKPKVLLPKFKKTGPKYVCISEYASSKDKMWSDVNDWQELVDYIKSVGYDVMVISKEPTMLTGIIDMTGGYSFHDRIYQLGGASLFIGVSSGLSWLSWAVGTHVMMISDGTPKWHEFQSNITRLSENEINCVDFNQKNVTPCEKVISQLTLLIG